VTRIIEEEGGLDKIERPIGVVLIAFANLVFYIAVLAYGFHLRSAPIASEAGGAAGLVAILFVVCLAYSIVGFIGVTCLLVRWRSFRELAMIGWAIECLPFAIIGVVNGYLFFQFLTEGIFGTSDFRIMLITAAIVLFKITSIVYFARKTEIRDVRSVILSSVLLLLMFLALSILL
jgi:hypothetical protein